MKKNILLLKCFFFALSLLSHTAFSQAPQAIPYQAVARDNQGATLTNQSISLRFSLRNVTATGTIVYQEIQNVTTNSLGLFSINLGQGIPVIGTMNTVDWKNGTKFLQVELDATGGTSYANMGSTQLMSVPFALHAESSASDKWSQNGSNISNINTGNIGIGTNTPAEKLEVIGKTKTTQLQIISNAGANKILVSDANGNANWSNANTIASGTLDQAYDFGGPGLGRTIVANAGALKITGDDGLLVTGTFGSGDDVETSGSGTRMFFNPKKAAFRVGRVTGTQWDSVNIGDLSTAFGYNNKASGQSATAMGYFTNAATDASTAMGFYTNANGFASTAMGDSTNADGVVSTAMGYRTNADGVASTAMGYFTNSIADGSTAMGHTTNATGIASTAMGYNTNATGIASTAIGYYTNATSTSSSAMGRETNADGYVSTAMGYSTEANGDYSTAMGNNTDANGDASTAMGHETNATSPYSTAMGSNTTASGISSTAMGGYTTATGDYSTAMGGFTTATGDYSTAMGFKTIANGYATLAIGRWNDSLLSSQTSVTANTPLFIIGNGSSATSRTNAMVVRYDGKVGIGTNTPQSKLDVAGGLSIGSTYAGTIAAPTNGAIIQGKVGIGTTSPSSSLQIEGGTDVSLTGVGYIILGDEAGTNIAMDNNEIMCRSNGAASDIYIQQDGGRVAIGSTGVPTHLLHVDGVARSTSISWAISSDHRVKKNINSLPNTSLQKIMHLRPVTYQWTDNYASAFKGLKQNNTGFISQELEQVFPEMIEKVEEKFGDETISDFRLLNLSDLPIHIVKAMQEQQTQIDKLEKELAKQNEVIKQILETTQLTKVQK